MVGLDEKKWDEINKRRDRSIEEEQREERSIGEESMICFFFVFFCFFLFLNFCLYRLLILPVTSIHLKLMNGQDQNTIELMV